jgi:CRP-like cAMP-binding protein
MSGNLMDVLSTEIEQTRARLATMEDLFGRIKTLEDETLEVLNGKVSDPVNPVPAPTPIEQIRRQRPPRRARARRGGEHGNTASQIVGQLREHPGQTAGELARDLGLKRNSVSTKLTQMAKQGYLTKLDRGYAVKD